MSLTEIEYQKLASEHRGKSSNGLGMVLWGRVAITTTVALLFSASNNGALWLLGQLVLGVSILQWFILVHDFGHNRFFSNTPLNDLAGHVAAFFVILPFYPWRYIHAHHHIWTGWRDQDPTMSVLKIQNVTPLKRRIVDFSWKYWIPVLTLAFSMSCFWNVPKLNKIWSSRKVRARFYFSILILPASYAALISIVGVARFMHFWALGYLFFLILSDPLLISQHSQIPQKMSHGKKVLPIHARLQDDFTRSLEFPAWVSRFLLLGFNNHVLHHFLPSVPCYRLMRIHKRTLHQIHWYTWLKTAKRIPAQQAILA